MKIHGHHNPQRALAAGALVLAITASVLAQLAPAATAGPADMAAGAANSCATYGVSFAGNARVGEAVSIDCRAESVRQTNCADSLLRYRTEYYALEVGANVKPFALGAGCENPGSVRNTGAAGGRASFRTPLATLHAFNGWDDVFLTTPADGLRDAYGYAQLTLQVQVPLRIIYHNYSAAYGSGDYGHEFDIVASKKFGKHWTVMVKYADYRGADAAAPAITANVDIRKSWAQTEFNF